MPKGGVGTTLEPIACTCACPLTQLDDGLGSESHFWSTLGKPQEVQSQIGVGVKENRSMGVRLVCTEHQKYQPSVS